MKLCFCLYSPYIRKSIKWPECLSIALFNVGFGTTNVVSDDEYEKGIGVQTQDSFRHPGNFNNQ